MNLFRIVLKWLCPKITWMIIVGIYNYFFNHYFWVNHYYFQGMNPGICYIHFKVKPPHIIKNLISTK